MKPNLEFDIKSSVVVFLVALPLCLGIALASNAPLASGLISGIVGGIVIGFLSDSQLSVSGPAAGLTVIVANGISQLGGFEYLSNSILLAGLFQIMFGLIRGGRIGDYFPTAVIKGMLAAIGLILILKQFPNTLGIGNNVLSLEHIKPGTAFVSLISLGLMLLWDKLSSLGSKLFQLVPGPLVAVIFSIVLNYFFNLIPQDGLVTLPSQIFKDVHLPHFLALTDLTVLKLALTIAIVASLETLLSTDAIDRIDPLRRKTNKNRELLAQGTGNFLCGILGGLPVTAVIVRSSANTAAGAKTKYSAVFHGIWLLLCILLIPNVLNLIPLATLACILLLVGYKLTKPVYFIEMWRRGPDQLFIFCSTIGIILATDLLKGIFAGLFIALLFELRKPALSCFELTHEGNSVHIKFTKNASFLHKAKISKLLNEIDINKAVHFHGMKLVRIHVDVHELINEFHENAKVKKRDIYFKS